MAHLLLELLTQLQAIGLADERSYRLPLTQETISDALGLSIPYVSRVLHQLRDAGLLRIEDHTVIIDDIEELAALADFKRAYLQPLPIAEFMAEHRRAPARRLVTPGRRRKKSPEPLRAPR